MLCTYLSVIGLYFLFLYPHFFPFSLPPSFYHSPFLLVLFISLLFLTILTQYASHLSLFLSIFLSYTHTCLCLLFQHNMYCINILHYLFIVSVLHIFLLAFVFCLLFFSFFFPLSVFVLVCFLTYVFPFTIREYQCVFPLSLLSFWFLSLPPCYSLLFSPSLLPFYSLSLFLLPLSYSLPVPSFSLSLSFSSSVSPSLSLPFPFSGFSSGFLFPYFLTLLLFCLYFPCFAVYRYLLCFAVYGYRTIGVLCFAVYRYYVVLSNPPYNVLHCLFGFPHRIF